MRQRVKDYADSYQSGAKKDLTTDPTRDKHESKMSQL